jgi:hypothetical protein
MILPCKNVYQGPLKCWYPTISLHNIMAQKTMAYIFITTKTSKLANLLVNFLKYGKLTTWKKFILSFIHIINKSSNGTSETEKSLKCLLVFQVEDFKLPQQFSSGVYPASAWQHHVNVGCTAVSEIHTISTFSDKWPSTGCCWYSTGAKLDRDYSVEC